MVAPAVVTFTQHPADYVAGPSPWFVQEGFSEGTKFTTVDHSTWIYTPGGAVERVIGSFRSTRTDTDFIALIAARDSTLTEEWQWGPAEYWTWSPTQHDFDVQSGDGSWPSDLRYATNLYIAWQRNASDVTTANDETVYWSNLVVIHRRYNYASGLVDAAAAPTLTVQGLVHDLMGRGVNDLVEYDPNRTAPGTPWSTVIPHAAWWDGVSAREVLEFAETWAPGMWWTLEERGPSKLPKFRVGRWDGPARYVLSRSDVELSGGGGDIANRCLVRYIGSTFRETSTTWVAEVRANVRGLAEAGMTRTMTLDLTGDGLMSVLDARLRGVSALRQAALAKTAGRAVITGPIMDLVEGRMVEPWEVEGGSPVIVADAPLTYSRSTSMVESVSPDGVAVFRGRSVSYDISSNTATMELDGGARSLIGRVRTEASPRRYDVGSARV